MTKAYLESSAATVKETIDNIAELVQSLSEELIRWKPSADEWSVAQILSHLNEAIPYWVGEIKRIKQDASATWGRGLADETRLAAVAEAHVNALPTAELLAQLKTVPATVEHLFQHLDENDLSIVAPSRNPKFNGQPLQFIIDHLIVEHVQKHLGQIKRNVNKWNENK
ncbi:DinB family protein [Geobacillus kaustophilus]|uniref:DinB family protein n=1 Tax=Geobacillus kaustophilus TaxID=1462 RepID=UPI0027DBA3A6|nr:DinB family protein [Geobacillus kaustophilus]WMJ20351.1 DinB family protein [Geobacillus kaustophilus]